MDRGYSRQDWAGFALTFFSYALVSRLTLLGMFDPQGMTSFWPAAGLAFGSLACSRKQLWRPLAGTILLASFVVNLSSGFTVTVSGGIAVANTVEPLLGAWLFRRQFPGPVHLESLGEALSLFVTAILGAAAGGLLGAAAVYSLGSGAPIGEVFPAWFVGDYLGIILMAPLVMSWWPFRELAGWIPSSRDRIASAWILGALALVAVLVFTAEATLYSALFTPFWTLPLLLLAALVLGVQGVSLGAGIVAVVAVISTVHGSGPFGLEELTIPDRILALQLYLILNIVPLLILAAAVTGLRRREEEYRRIIDTSREAVWVTDLRDRTVFASDRLARFLRVDADRIIGRTPEEILGGSSILSVDELLEAQRGLGGETALQESSVPRQEVALPEIEGEPLPWVEIATDVIQNRRGRPVGVLRMVADISRQKVAEAEREALEASLRQSQKLEAVGRLAGGIAHDFNNLLTVILGYAEVLLMGSSVQDPASRRQLQSVVSASEGARKLIEQLLAFSRKQVLQVKEADLRAVVEHVAQMVDRIVGEDVHIVLELPAEPVVARVDPHLVEQALVNLVVNARDAMPRGGTIQIRASAGVPEPRPDAVGPPHPTAQCAIVRVTDTGRGIEVADMERIFDPFFSTKELGRGTGLGLAMVHGTVTQQGGDVRAWSTAGEGSTFELLLPLADVKASPKMTIEEDRDPTPGVETVLILEDEPAVLGYVCGALKDLGYRVVGVSSGEEALEVLAGSQEVDLLLSDVVMSGMSGMQVWEAARQLRPGIKVLFMSGYSEGLLQRRGTGELDAPFIAKPFRIRELSGKIRAVLDSPPGEGSP